MIKRKAIILLLCLTMFFTINGLAFADTTTVFSPGYRVKSSLDENQLGYQSISATIVLPNANDISGVNSSGAVYNYLGIETSDGKSLEIGLHKDYYDLANGKWSVFSYANYNGAFINYGSNERWHNFRYMPWSPQGPDLTYSDGSKATMTLSVANNDEVIFELTGFDPVVLKLPGTNPEGKGQIFRRVTSIMTDEPSGFTKNNRWEEVKLQKANEDFVLWVPQEEQILKSNNLDLGDPNDSSIAVNHQEYYPETVDINGLKPMEQIKPQEVKFTLDQASYSVNGAVVEMDAAPYLANGRSFVPVRYLAEAIGINNIAWNEANRSVTLTLGEKVVTLVVDQQTMATTSGAVLMDVCPQTKDDRIYLPAKYVAEAFGYYASWDPDTQTVTIQ